MWIDDEFMSEPQIKAYIKKINQGNAELKAMLKQVASDLECYRNFMKDNDRCCVRCENCIFNNNKEGCKYVHMDKIKTLIDSEDKKEGDKNGRIL